MYRGCLMDVRGFRFGVVGGVLEVEVGEFPACCYHCGSGSGWGRSCADCGIGRVPIPPCWCGGSAGSCRDWSESL